MLVSLIYKSGFKRNFVDVQFCYVVPDRGWFVMHSLLFKTHEKIISLDKIKLWDIRQ